MLYMQPEVRQQQGESFTDYFLRLFDRKQEYELNCEEICKLLNDAGGENKDSSTWRKEYAAFNRGRRYEQANRMRGVATKVLALSDLHFPFSLPIERFAQFKDDVDVLVINGDVVDLKEISKFRRDYRQSPMDEIIGAREYLIQLIAYLKPREVHVTYGNHDARFGKYLAKNLDTTVIELMPETPLELILEDGMWHYDKMSHSKTWYTPLDEVFTDIKVYYAHSWWTKIGKCIFAHPQTYSSAMLKTTDKAISHFLRNEKDFDTVVLGHTHKLGAYIQGGVYAFEQGCCCDTKKLTYADGQLALPQQQGCMLICQDADGNLLFDKTRLVVL